MTMSKSVYRLAGIAALAAAFIAVPAASAMAATIFVGKSGSGGGSCSKPNFKNIAAAVNAASANDTVHICKGTWTGASNRGIQFAKPLKFVGDGPGQTIIDLQNQDLFLNGTNGAISVSAMKITKGLTTVGYGGAVLAYDGNTTTPYDLTAKNVVITDTQGNSYGSALYGDNVTVSNSTFTDNTADDGTVYAQTSALVEDSTFRRNVNDGDGAGVFVDDDGPADYDLVVEDSVFTDNTGAGGYYGGTLTAYNGGAKLLRVSGSGSETGEYGGFLYSDENAVVSKVVLEDNSSDYDGGAIYANANLDVSDSEFSNNVTSGSGGGVYVHDDLNSRQATYSNNIAGDTGGGMEVGGDLAMLRDSVEGNDSGAALGAGLYTDGSIAVIQQSSISDNTCTGNTGSCSAMALNNGAEVIQSTVAGNSTDEGNAIYTDGGDLTLVNSTVANNEGSSVIYAGGGVSIGFSTIADNTVDDLIIASGILAIGSSILEGSGACTSFANTNNAFNVITTDNGCDAFVGPTPAAKVTAAALDLQPLADNGGPTRTMAITAGSAALDAGDPGDLLVDQRDWLRGPVPDTGAFEYGAIAPLPTIVKRGKAGAKSLKVRVGCEDGDPCTVIVTGKLKGGKGKLRPKRVTVPEGETVLVTVQYAKKLAGELADKTGKQTIRVTAQRLYGGKASTNVIYQGAEPKPVTG